MENFTVAINKSPDLKRASLNPLDLIKTIGGVVAAPFTGGASLKLTADGIGGMGKSAADYGAGAGASDKATDLVDDVSDIVKKAKRSVAPPVSDDLAPRLGFTDIRDMVPDVPKVEFSTPDTSVNAMKARMAKIEAPQIEDLIEPGPLEYSAEHLEKRRKKLLGLE